MYWTQQGAEHVNPEVLFKDVSGVISGDVSGANCRGVIIAVSGDVFRSHFR